MRYATVKGYCGCLIGLWLLVAIATAAKTIRIYVANYEATTVDVIDPVTKKVVQVIDGIPAPHGVVGSPDGRRIYVSSESEEAATYEELQKSDRGVLDVVDQKTGKIIKKIALSGRPNNIAITKDGRRVLVCIRSGQGGLDIVDTTSLERIKTIPTSSGLHNVYLTRDGKYAVASSPLAHSIVVIDLQTEEPVWDVKFEWETRVLTLESGPDGSTSRIFAQLEHLRGFAVVDFATHKEAARIELPTEPRAAEGSSGGNSHGIGVNPDGKTLWVSGGSNNCVFVYSLPGLKLMGYVPTGGQPSWLSFSPSGDMVYVSNAKEGTESLIDTKNLQEVAHIAVGKRPMRTAALVLP
jgi:YVTN family beta-propeller protein